MQGELIGEGIQKNKYKIKKQEIYWFQAWDIDHQRYLDDVNFDTLCGMLQERIEQLPMRQAPIIEYGELTNQSIDVWLELAEGKSLLNPNQEREGLVIRTRDNSFMFKAIFNKFLLKE